MNALNKNISLILISCLLSSCKFGAKAKNAVSPGGGSSSSILSPNTGRTAVSGNSVITGGSCQKYDVSITDESGKPMALSSDAQFQLARGGQGRFFALENCQGAATTSISVKEGSTAFSFYYRNNASEDVLITVTSTGLTGSNKAIMITARGSNDNNKTQVFLRGDDSSNAIAAATDGGYFLAGSSVSSISGRADGFLAKINSSGDLDPGFSGGSGRVFLSNGSETKLNGVAVGSTKVFVVGTTQAEGGTPDFFLGITDLDGNNPIKVSTDFSSGSDEAFSAVISGSTVYVVGRTRTGDVGNFAVAAYDFSGNLVGSFGSSGKKQIDFTSSGSDTTVDEARAIKATSSGLILFGTTVSSKGASDFAFCRIGFTGNLDSTFGSSGKRVVDFNSRRDVGNALLVLTDDSVVGVGSSIDSATRSDFALTKLDSSGSLVTTFGTSGKTTLDFQNEEQEGVAVGTDAAGNIYVAGSNYVGNYNYSLVQFSANGVYLSGTSFVLDIDLERHDIVTGVLISGSKIFLNGFTNPSRGVRNITVAKSTLPGG